MDTQLHLNRRRVLTLPLIPSIAHFSSPLAAKEISSYPIEERLFQERRFFMGTLVDIAVAVEHRNHPQAHQAVGSAWARMSQLEALMSRYHAGSDIARISAAAGRQPVAIAPEVMALLQMGKKLYQESAHTFDMTVGTLREWEFAPGKEHAPTAVQIQRALPLINTENLLLDERAGTAYLQRAGMALDLGGLAKLPILQAGLQILKSAGFDNVLINGGGDVLLSGHQYGRPWRVGVRDPLKPERLLGVLKLQGNHVVASSGDYERCFFVHGRRLHHVLNPRTGWPTEGVHGVVLVSTDVHNVNGWGTALMVGGLPMAQKWTSLKPNVQGLLVTSDGRRWETSDIAQMLHQA